MMTTIMLKMFLTVGVVVVASTVQVGFSIIVVGCCGGWNLGDGDGVGKGRGCWRLE